MPQPIEDHFNYMRYKIQSARSHAPLAKHKFIDAHDQYSNLNLAKASLNIVEHQWKICVKAMEEYNRRIR